jgi:peptide subunit release factor 1 (eRF1)
MDQELIRKAAEAIWEIERIPSEAFGRVQINLPYDKVPRGIRDHIEAKVKAALTVFYEHTRAQKRERHGVSCPDCNAAMIPTTGSSHWTCPNCGKTV